MVLWSVGVEVEVGSSGGQLGLRFEVEVCTTLLVFRFPDDLWKKQLELMLSNI